MSLTESEARLALNDLKAGRSVDLSPDHLERLLQRWYALRGPTYCAERLGRSMHGVAAKAARMGLSFGVVKGYVPVKDVALASGKNHSGIWHRAKKEGVLRVEGAAKKAAMVPEAWAQAFIDEAKAQREGDKARAAGYLRIREAAAILGVGFGTVQRGLTGRGYLARLQHARVVRGKRGSININPYDLERVRVELEQERRSVEGLESAKGIWLDSGLNRSTSNSRLRALPGKKVLKGGRIQMFVEKAA